jgi:hypothetical protein
MTKVNKKIFFLTLYICISLMGCSNQQSLSKVDSNSGDDANKHELPEIKLCRVPEPEIPSSAFTLYKSKSEKKSGYWVRYQCKQECTDWSQCLVPAYSNDGGALLSNGRNPDKPKQALAFVVDGMAGHLAISDGDYKTVFIHTGAGGTRYYARPAESLEQMSSAHTVMIRWEKGYTSPIVQSPFTSPITWGWYSRTSEQPTDIKELNARVASVIAWSHDNLSNNAMFGTLGCSMGTNATFGPVLWHGLDPIIDYQLFVGGPNMWDLNAQCGRRHYDKGYCDYDGVTSCRDNNECLSLDKNSKCVMPGKYTTIDKLFEQLPNHIHATDACDIRASDESTPAYPPFDQSSMAYARGADWEIDHKMDFLVNLGAKQGATRTEGLGGDEYWALGHFPYVYNKIKPDANKTWRAYPDTHHCDGMFDSSLDLIKQRMGL